MYVLSPIARALYEAFLMFWVVLWPLVLGFTLSGVIQALVSKRAMARTLGGDNLKCYSLAALLGAASSSCSYAAVALARSIFRKGASFTSSMVFEIASTNLVLELGLILLFFLGWQFALAEWLGGIIMIVVLIFLMRLSLSKKLILEARSQAEKGILGRMEGHAEMDMSLKNQGPFWQKVLTKDALTSVSHFFVMDWSSVLFDLVLGFLIAGALTVFVPHSFWQAFFLKDNPTLSFIEGPFVGPAVAILSFVCSIGNIPLAAVLWAGGISFGGVVSFIFADLIVLPILDIYRKYYGWKTMFYILGTFYLTMVCAGFVVEIIFSSLGLVPTERTIGILEEGFKWNYTSFLNIIFIFIAGILVWRFFKTGGMSMFGMMNKKNHEM